MRTLHVGIAATVFGLGIAAFSAACDQPAPRCTITTLEFFARYAPKAGQPQGCNLKGELLYAASYNPPQDPATAPFKDAPDVNTITFAIKSVDVAGRLAVDDAADETKVYSLAKFDQSQPGKDGICTAATFQQQTDITVAVPAVKDDPSTKDVDETAPAIPPTRFQYDWSNFKTYVTAATTGIQFSADLVRTETAQGGTPVRCEYTVAAMAPAVTCDDGKGKPDDVLCDPNGDLDAGRLLGSGISPDIDQKCDPDLLYCLPPANTPIPNLRAAQ